MASVDKSTAPGWYSRKLTSHKRYTMAVGPQASGPGRSAWRFTAAHPPDRAGYRSHSSTKSAYRSGLLFLDDDPLALCRLVEDARGLLDDDSLALGHLVEDAALLECPLLPRCRLRLATLVEHLPLAVQHLQTLLNLLALRAHLLPQPRLRLQQLVLKETERTRTVSIDE
eukprot:1177116-Prorocentrum_minimum.AAC.1